MERTCEADGIIASSPTMPADETTLAHRIVIRDMATEFVVHMQIFNKDGSYFFSDGNYVTDLKAAWKHFVRRATLILNFSD